MEEIKCIICNQPAERVVIEENGFTGRKCNRCQVIFISPRPGQDELLNIYSHDEAGTSSASHLSEELLDRLQARHHLRILSRYVKKGSLLELGAGSGFFLDEARKQGFDVSGIELNGKLVSFIREKLHIPCEDVPLSQASFGGKKFDVIYHCDVISHFYNPREELEKMRDKLVSHGILMFETGNLGEVDEKYLKKIKRFQYPDHLFFFSETSLRELLEKTGFELLKVHRYSILPLLGMYEVLEKMIGVVKGNKHNTTSVEPGGSGTAAEKTIKTNEPGNTEQRAVSLPLHKRIIKTTVQYLTNFVRYSAGAAAPLEKRPRTDIYIARKTE